MRNSNSVYDTYRPHAGAVGDGRSFTENYSILNSTIGDEDFAFDDEVINSRVYRKALANLTSR